MIPKFARTYIRKKPRLLRWLLGIFVRMHNYSYKKITEYASALNGGVSPKHEITKYHDYFIAHITPNDSVLDIGCGFGILANAVAKKAKRVVGIDISKSSIAYAKSHYERPNLEFILGDATEYPFIGRFDKLILSNVLEHIKDRVGLLKKIGKLGDTLLFRVPMITREWMAVWKRDNGYPYKLDDTHETEYTLEDIERECRESGWRVESCQVNWGEFWGVLRKVP